MKSDEKMDLHQRSLDVSSISHFLKLRVRMSYQSEVKASILNVSGPSILIIPTAIAFSQY